MFCENCGKQLIRGYQFCIECGTPVPPEPSVEEPAENSAAGETASSGRTLPSVEPINNESGSLVYCPNCGMHMQTSNVFCEKCGIRLSGSGGADDGAGSAGGTVPMWNANPQPFGENLGDYSDDELNQIDSFMNGNGGINGYDSAPADIMGGSGGISGGGMDEIEALTQQLASFGASASEMPEIGSVGHYSESEPIRYQKEPELGQSREVEDFSMGDDGGSLFGSASDSGLPVIEGASMDEDPSKDISLDPYAFVNNVISDSEPAYTEPVAEEPAYNEPVAEEPVYNEPVAEEPAYNDFTAEEPAYTEPVAEEPVYNEPVAEEPAYTEPVAEEPAYNEPVAEEPAYTEPIAEETAYNEPVAEEPAYNEPVAEEPVYNEPVAEEPAYTEPVAEEPVYNEPVAEQPEDNYFENEAPFMEEVAPVIAEAPRYEPTVSGYDSPADSAAPEQPAEPEQPKGNLVYCRNCGQDMYDTEAVCKNCGAPYKGMYVPPRNAPSKTGSGAGGEKKGGKKWIPIAAASVVAVGIAVVLIATTSRPSDNANLTGNNNLPVTQSTTTGNTDPVTDTSGQGGDNAAISTDVNTAEAVTTPVPASDETDPAISTDTHDAADTTSGVPDTSEPVTGESTHGSGSTSHTTKPTTTKPTTTKPNTTKPTTTKPTTTSTAKTTAYTTKSTTATTSKPVGVITSSKVKSLEKDREAIMDAAAVMAGEIGKIEMFAQNVIYAIDNSSGSADTTRTAYYSRDFAKNMLSIIKSGKSDVDSALLKAEPSNSEMDTAYDSLKSLKKKYDAYYNFIISPTGKASKFGSECSTYLSAFTNALSSGLKFSKLTTSDYSSGDSGVAYAAAMSDAVTAANNAVSALSTLQTKLTDLGSRNFESGVVAELSKSSVTKTYANAAAYSMRVKAYTLMLAGAPDDYSSALKSLTSANRTLESLVDSYSMIQENTFSNYKSESSDAISTAKSYISSVTKAIS